jgi:hypothetical protein
MYVRYLFSYVLMCLFLIMSTSAMAQTLGQTDTFQDGTLNSWTSGSPNPAPPSNISTGGPQGSGDRYIRAASIGGGGAGSKLVIFNTKQWTGNFIAAGIGNIKMSLKNEGSSSLQMRIAILSNASSCSSANPVSVPVGSGWMTVNFPLSASALTGGTVNTILSNVTEIRLLHESAPGTKGDPIAGQLGIDNITATALSTNVDAPPSDVPGRFLLSQNYPNPFNPTTTINFELPAPGSATLKVFNQLGQEVATLLHGEMMTKGSHSIQFQGSGLSSGIYYYRLEAGNNIQVKQLVLMK